MTSVTPLGIADIVKLPAVLSAILLAGCATFHVEPANLPLRAPQSNLVANDTGLSGNEDDLFVGLAFSGGGMRPPPSLMAFSPSLIAFRFTPETQVLD